MLIGSQIPKKEPLKTKDTHTFFQNIQWGFFSGSGTRLDWKLKKGLDENETTKA